MNSVHDTSRDAEPVQQMKKMEGFGGGGNSGPVAEFRNSPVGGGPSAGSGGMGNFDQRTVQGAMGAMGNMLNKGKQMLEQNEYTAKAMQAGQQAAQAVGFGQGTGQQYAAASDGTAQQSHMGTYAGGPSVSGGQFGQPSGGFGQQPPQQPAQARSSMPNKIKVEAGEYEAKIIDDLCEPSGARPNPNKDVVAKFVRQCGSLDADLCCALLEEKLEDEDWKVVLKALVGIESLITAKKSGVAEYFDAPNDEFIKEIAVDPESQKSLKAAAEKCLQALEKATAAPVVDTGMSDMFTCILWESMQKDEKQLLIDKVTENNESPAPGWALDQLARLTVQKPGIENEMAELFFKRLGMNSCDVKLKTLRALAFISRRGTVAFRRACQRQSQLIRQHLSTHLPFA